MKQKAIIGLIGLLFLGTELLIGRTMDHQDSIKRANTAVIRYDDTSKLVWNNAFAEILISSTKDTAVQKAYFYRTTESTAQPLVVSLHTWSGDYTQKDTLSLLSKGKNWNYIHPDFRGKNIRKEACCSEYVIGDIDDAIDYAIQHANVDTTRIFVIGASGGGMATLFTFMKSRHKVKKFSAWVPVTDVAAFYHNGLIRHNKYPAEALACVGSVNNSIDTLEAAKRSPLYCRTPVKKLDFASVEIYTGIYDGIQGSVPVSHAVNMYNKIVKDLNDKNSRDYVSDYEKSMIYNQLKPSGVVNDSIGHRAVFLKKKYKNVQLIIFEGNHEMLPVYAFEHLN